MGDGVSLGKRLLWAALVESWDYPHDVLEKQNHVDDVDDSIAVQVSEGEDRYLFLVSVTYVNNPIYLARG